MTVGEFLEPFVQMDATRTVYIYMAFSDKPSFRGKLKDAIKSEYSSWVISHATVNDGGKCELLIDTTYGEELYF